MVASDKTMFSLVASGDAGDPDPPLIPPLTPAQVARSLNGVYAIATRRLTGSMLRDLQEVYERNHPDPAGRPCFHEFVLEIARNDQEVLFIVARNFVKMEHEWYAANRKS